MPSIEETDHPAFFPRTPYPYYTSNTLGSSSKSSPSPTGRVLESSNKLEELALSPEKDESIYEPKAAQTLDFSRH